MLKTIINISCIIIISIIGFWSGFLINEKITNDKFEKQKVQEIA